MIGHLFAAIPGQRFVEFSGQFVSMLNECVDHRFGVFVLNSNQHDVASMPLNQRRDLTIVAADNQVTLPVSGQCSVFNRGGTLATLVFDILTSFLVVRLAVLRRR